MPRHVSKKMRIAMVAPCFGPNGGAEVVVQNLTDALLQKGADVTLFAPADWKTKAKHIVTLPQSLWNMPDFQNQTETVRRNLILSSQVKVLGCQNDFDIVHLHVMKYAFVIANNLNRPSILTTHNSLSLPTYDLIRSTNATTVAISKSNKKRTAGSRVIYNGIPTENIIPSFEKGEYLIAIGRLTFEKGIHEAIKIAKSARKKLIIIGRIGVSENRKEYFEKHIKPHIDGKNIIHINEVSHNKIYEYLRKASALIFTPLWEEPFGMVAVEALASGTPVIGFPSGALTELINDNSIGFLSKHKNELVRAVNNSDQFDRKKCRRRAEKFDSSIMAEKYLNLYRKIIEKRT